MSKRWIKAGSADQTIDIFVPDASSASGGGLTGLVFNSAGLTCYYRKGATGTPTALTLATQTVGGAHSDGGFVAVDGTNCPGQYRLDLSDTIVATAGMVTLYLRGATNMVPVVLEIEVVAVDIFDTVRLGLTALPNAAAEAAGGLYTRGSGAGQINQANNGQIDVNAARLGGTTQTGRDIGASVLLSNGTGAGQVKLSSGYVSPNGADISSPATALAHFFTADTGQGDGDAVNGSVVKETADKVWNSASSGWNIGSIGELFGTFSNTVSAIASRIGGWAGSGQNTILGAFQALFRSDTDAAVPSDINADLGSGAGDANNTTDSVEALRDRGDAAWVTGGAGLTQADVRSAVGLASASLDTQLSGIQSDTNDLQSRVPAALVGGRMDASVGAMQADVVTASAIAPDAIGNSELAASAVTEIQSGLSTLDAAGVRAALGMGSPNLDTQLSAIVGFLDTEIAAILAAIGGLNNLSSAQVWDLANGIETGETPRQTLRLLRSVLVGLSAITSGTSEIGTVEFKRKDGTTVAVTVDYDTGEREAVTVGTLT